VKILLDETRLRHGIEKLAADITSIYGDHPLTIVGIMTGSIILMADVVRLLEMPLRVGVVQTSSYQGTERRKLKINAEMMPDITGRDVLLLDDIFDTGHTMAEVISLMHQLEPASLRSAVLLSKTGRQQVDLKPDFVVFDIPDEFVVGYGLDYEDEYRNLPYVAALEPADIQSVCKK
jgi:hypoxanthine phosphoribosyltransferase